MPRLAKTKVCLSLGEFLKPNICFFEFDDDEKEESSDIGATFMFDN